MATTFSWASAWPILSSPEVHFAPQFFTSFLRLFFPQSGPRRRLSKFLRASRTSVVAMSWGKAIVLVSSWAICIQSVLAVTIYGQTPLGFTRSASGAASSYTGLPAYNTTILIPPVIDPAPSPYSLQLTNNVSAVEGVSIPVNGPFYGFSIEFSVVNQIGELT